MRLMVVAGLLALAGCGPQFKPIAHMGEAEQRAAYECYAQAKAAGASAGTMPGIGYQVMAQARTEVQVYEFCMRGKGYNPMAQ